MKFTDKTITLELAEIKIIRDWHTEEYSSDGKDFILKKKLDSWLELYGNDKGVSE